MPLTLVTTVPAGDTMCIKSWPFRLEDAFTDLWMFSERSLIEAATAITALDEAIRQ